MSVGEICTREVVICKRDETIREAAALMRDHHVGSLIVVEECAEGAIPVGILTDRDIVIRVLAADRDPDACRLAEAMSGELVTVGEADEILDTMELMRDRGIRRIPVVNRDGVLEGILTVDDLVELLAEQLTDLARLCGRQLKHEGESPDMATTGQ